MLEKDGQLLIEAIGTEDQVIVLQSMPLQATSDLPISLINYVTRTQQPLVVNDALEESLSNRDPYILRCQPKAILCAPILYQGRFTGLIYLENNLTIGAFTPDRLELLKLLTAQAAIALENAQLYAREQDKSHQLQQSLHKLQQTQAQLIQTEKISSLGQLVAGVAHEVNNPVGFISGNLNYAQSYVDELIYLLRLYRKHLPTPPAEIAKTIEEIDLDYLIEDLPKLLSSMKLGTDRIKEVMQSLRIYSRADGKQKTAADIHEGLETTLMILQHRLKANSDRSAIQVVKQYGDLPLIDCYIGQLNQVFTNLLANAIDALEESNAGKSYAELMQSPNIITLKTMRCPEAEPAAIVCIVDNGSGIPKETQQRMFDPFFTTETSEKGTGLGLSISYQIVVEQHGGSLTCVSKLGRTEFIIALPMQQSAIVEV